MGWAESGETGDLPLYCTLYGAVGSSVRKVDTVVGRCVVVVDGACPLEKSRDRHRKEVGRSQGQFI